MVPDPLHGRKNLRAKYRQDERPKWELAHSALTLVGTAMQCVNWLGAEGIDGAAGSTYECGQREYHPLMKSTLQQAPAAQQYTPDGW